MNDSLHQHNIAAPEVANVNSKEKHFTAIAVDLWNSFGRKGNNSGNNKWI